ncbi:DUF6891 domain-containing protein [Corynebacterium singulare]|uniref:DUF6891 domain-containing protein n=1 Tax=Corynebacterium singulare TaxID=161899 RepID=A0ABS9PWL9_9CORY|nr:hypothetical protein [Corynebacterium singulare]MCG7277105.1 hypothetical protein [Corynebacterium singulare]
MELAEPTFRSCSSVPALSRGLRGCGEGIAQRTRSQVRGRENDFFEVLDDPSEWKANHAEPYPEDFDAIIDEVAAEYGRLVTEKSEDAKRLDALHDELAQRDISFTFNEAWDMSDGAWVGSELAEEEGHSGYVYCHRQDISRAIYNGELYFGFSAMEKSEEATIKVGEQLVDALRAVGFAPEWNGSTKARILCHDVALEFPLADDLTD